MEHENTLRRAKTAVENLIASAECEWKEYKKGGKGRIIVYQRHNDDSKLSIYMGVAEMALSPSRVLQLVSDSEKRREWDPSVVFEDTRTVKSWKTPDMGEILIYRDAHSSMLGGIISGRDMSNIRNVSVDEAKYESVFVSVVDASLIPEEKKYVRAWCNPSGMIGKIDESTGKLKMYYVLETDPRGKIPSWATGKAIAQSIIDLLAFLIKHE